MKKKIVMLVLSCFLLIPFSMRAQVPVVDLVGELVAKVIIAIDLKVQRLQNETIWLQNAQKVLENKMSELKLGEIGDRVEKQRKLYADYFDELWKVKNTIATYQRVRDIIKRQLQMVKEYEKAYSLSRQDKNFTQKEINYMYQVYSGILNESVKNLEQVQMVISAFVTQMSDAKRMEIINTASDNIEQNISDLRQFNQENIRTSLQRAKERNDIDVVKKLYGL